MIAKQLKEKLMKDVYCFGIDVYSSDFRDTFEEIIKLYCKEQREKCKYEFLHNASDNLPSEIIINSISPEI